MTPRVPRVIQLVHSLPGRARFRLGWLRGDPEAATALADQLAGLEGMLEVRVRPRTGSVLCRYREPLDEARLVRALRRQTHVAVLRRPGEAEPAAGRNGAPGAVPPGSATVARALAESARDLNRQVVDFTEGRLDLATLAALAFLAGGAIEVAVTRRLPVPPWFNLAWWAFRTFMQFEQDAVNGTAPEQPRGRPPRPGARRPRRRVRPAVVRAAAPTAGA